MKKLILTLASLSYAEVDWVIPIVTLRIQSSNEQSVTLNHHFGVR